MKDINQVTGTFFITKYALTRGILKVQGRVAQNEPKMLITGPITPGGFKSNYFHGDDWWDTEEAAKEHAHYMRDREVQRLVKRANKLDAMTFSKQRIITIAPDGGNWMNLTHVLDGGHS